MILRGVQTMLKKQKNLLAVLFLSSILLLSVSCGNKPPEQSEAPAAPEQTLELTLEELAYYDGSDGKPAYVAVDGIIYDMTNSNAWKNGLHNGFQAGKDLSSEIKNVSPHGTGKLNNVPIIGKLIEKSTETAPAQGGGGY